MKNIKQIKKELVIFAEKHNACHWISGAIKGDTLSELFDNISIYIFWYKDNETKARQFNKIFNNGLVVQNKVLLCNCSNEKSITIPDGIVKIGNCAFMKCKDLESVIIPNSVTYIDDYAFNNCSNLKEVTMPTSLSHIGNFVFENCCNFKVKTQTNNKCK